MWLGYKTTLINLSGLTIGMTSAFFVFMWVQNEYSYNGYHTDADRIYRLKTLREDRNSTGETTPYLLGEEVKQLLPEVQVLTRINPNGGDEAPVITIDGQQIKEKNAATVDENWFDIFHYDFIEGSAQAFNSQPYSVILSESHAKKYFGTESPLGKPIRLDSIDYQVQGVIKDYPPNSSFRYHMYLPLSARRANPELRESDDTWGMFGYLTFVKIPATSDPLDIAPKITDIMTANHKRGNVNIGLIGLKEMHFEDDVQFSVFLHGNKQTANIFLVLGCILLGIACINYINLTTARASSRLKEVSIKKIVGAGKKQLFVQFLTESILMSLVALLMTILLIWIGLPFFNQLTDNRFSFLLSDGSLWRLLGFTLFITVLLTSIYPALLLSSFNPIAIFRGKNLLGLKDSLLRKSLVILQFSISIALIIGTVVIYRQMQFIQLQNVDYNKSQVITFSVPGRLWLEQYNNGQSDIRNSIKQKLMAESSIELVSALNGGSVVNMQFSASGGYDWKGREQDFYPPIAPFQVDSDFNEMVNLNLIDGRWFMPHSIGDQKNVVLNETAVREFGLQSPTVGQWFVSPGITPPYYLDTGVVIGVVRDFFYKSIHEPIDPVVIKNEPGYASTFLVKTAAGRHEDALHVVERTWKQLIPDIPLEYQFADEEFDALYRSDRKAASLILAFSLLAISISCLGLYALVTFNTERRTKEIGIRKVLGASEADIVRMLSSDFVKLVLVAILIASPIAWYAMNRWLADFAYRIELEWWMFGLAGLVAVVVALLTVSFQAIRAAVANPVESLRSE